MTWKFPDWEAILNIDWPYLEEKYDWVHDMKGVPQDPIFHAEGDVAIHTQMVILSLLKMEEFQALEEQEQHILGFAALVHDIEKRSTTVHELDGRITSKGHARKGAQTVRALLYCQFEVPFAIRELIVKLVRHHGLPLWVFEKPDPVKSLLGASLEVNTQLLSILAKADALGRICPDQEDLLYRISLFEELCKEWECWGQARNFSSKSGRFVYFNGEDKSPNYIPFEKKPFEVTLMCALPGTGKDTFIAQNHKDLPMVSLDAIRRQWKISPRDKKKNGKVIQEAKAQARQFLRKQQPFVWNATNLTQSLRKQLVQLFSDYGAQVRIIYLEVPYKTLLRQNRNREYMVPEKVIRQMIRKLEVPVLGEGHVVEYRIQVK